jgi:Ca2+-binding EF-hand superfamily protein
MEQFEAVFDGLRSALRLTDRDIAMLMREADTNDDGVVDYQEFVPVAVDLIDSMIAKRRAETMEATEDVQAHEAAADYLLNGISGEELESLLQESFINADADGSGYLDAKEFRNCIKATKLRLSRRDINYLIVQTDADGDGKITYQEFVPTCFSLILEMAASDIRQQQQPQEVVEYANYLLAICEREDSQSSGFLEYTKLEDILMGDGIQLTRVQAHTVLSDAREEEDGTVEYKAFVQRAAALMLQLELVQETRLAEAEEEEAADADEADDAGGTGLPDLNEIYSMVIARFQAEDPSNTGTIPKDLFISLFSDLREQLKLTERELNKILCQVEDYEDVPYWEYVPLAVELIDAMYAKMRADQTEADLDAEAHNMAADYLLNGMNEEELKQILSDTFKKSDADGNGVLDAKEFRKCLKDSGLKLNKKEIAALLVQTDVDGDGQITYDEFVPTCFSLLLEVAARDIKKMQESPEMVAVEEFLAGKLAEADLKKCGVIQLAAAKETLEGSGLGLTAIEMHTVFSEAREHADGSITISEFTRPAAAVLVAMESVKEARAWEQF